MSIVSHEAGCSSDRAESLGSHGGPETGWRSV